MGENPRIFFAFCRTWRAGCEAELCGVGARPPVVAVAGGARAGIAEMLGGEMVTVELGGEIFVCFMDIICLCRS